MTERPGWRVGPGRRFLARMLDALVLLVPVLIVTDVVGDGFLIGESNNSTDTFVSTALGVGLSYAYFVVLEARRGRTIGKDGVDVEAWSWEEEDGRTVRPSLTRAAQRNAWMLLGVIPGNAGGLLLFGAAIVLAVSIGADPLGRGLHDRWAGVVLKRET